MQSIYKSGFTNILCLSWEMTDAKHIISIAAHLVVLIQWTSKQVSQPPTHLAAAGLLNQLENCVLQFVSVHPQTRRAQKDHECRHALNKLQSNCLNLSMLVTHKAKSCYYTAYSS